MRNTLQRRRTVQRSGGGSGSNLVGIICPPVRIRFTGGEGGGEAIAPFALVLRHLCFEHMSYADCFESGSVLSVKFCILKLHNYCDIKNHNQYLYILL